MTCRDAWLRRARSSNGATAQRRFAYDRWGNRTTAWDAVSGGNQIQTVTLQQSGGVPTNQIATVNAVGFSYDAAGNVTNDGSHSYTYDAENRVVSIDGGAAQYGYDHRNWRVKKIASGATTHYVISRSEPVMIVPANASRSHRRGRPVSYSKCYTMGLIDGEDPTYLQRTAATTDK
ncbi:MAG: hypothetical protein AABN34_13410 [Acidobacteriota bacterium]